MPKKYDRNIYAWSSIAIAVAATVIWLIYVIFVKSSYTETSSQTRSTDLLKEHIKDEFENSSAKDIMATIEEEFTIDIYQQQIIEQIQSIQAKYSNADLVERIVLESELALQQAKMENHKRLYSETVKLLSETFQVLKSFKGILPLQDYNFAQAALVRGDTGLANNQFSKIEDRYRDSKERHEIYRAAEAVYQQGEISRNQTDYRNAYRYYRQAVKYNPDNIMYLIAAANVSDSIALYGNAILYYEAALFHLQKEKQNESQTQESQYDLRQLWISLGEAYNSKCNAVKAIRYFELALASDLETFGPNHPNVVMDKHYLSSACNRGQTTNNLRVNPARAD